MGGDEPYFHPTPVDPISVNTINLSTGTVPIMTDMGTIRTVQTVDVAGGNAYPTTFVAMRGFGFTLGTDQDGEPFSSRRGRYLRKLTFLVNAANYDPLAGTLELEAKTGYKTVETFGYNSTVEYRVLPTILQFADASSGAKDVVGTVCHSSDRALDVVFSCGPNVFNGLQLSLPEQDSDIVQTGLYLQYDPIPDLGLVLSPATK